MGTITASCSFTTTLICDDLIVWSLANDTKDTKDEEEAKEEEEEEEEGLGRSSRKMRKVRNMKGGGEEEGLID